MIFREFDIQEWLKQIKDKLQSHRKQKSDTDFNPDYDDLSSQNQEGRESSIGQSLTEKLRKAVSFIINLPRKQLINYVIIPVISLIVLSILWHVWGQMRLYSKATQQVMQQLSTNPVMIQQLGNNIASTHRGSGEIQMPQLTGDLSIPVQGNLARATVKVQVNEGKLDQVILTKEDGKVLDVLQLQKQEEERAKALAAAQAKLAAVEQGFQQAVHAMESSNFAQAVPGFAQAIANNYRVVDAYEYLAIIASNQGDYDQCIENFTRFLQLKGDDANGQYQLAYCYLQRYDTVNALKYLAKSCQLGNQNACQAQVKVESQQQAMQQQTQATEHAAPGVPASTGGNNTMPASAPAVAPADNSVMPASVPPAAAPVDNSGIPANPPAAAPVDNSAIPANPPAAAPLDNSTMLPAQPPATNPVETNAP